MKNKQVFAYHIANDIKVNIIGETCKQDEQELRLVTEVDVSGIQRDAGVARLSRWETELVFTGPRVIR